MNYKSTLWIFILISVLFSLPTIKAQQSTVEGFKLTITFVEEPGSDLNIYQAPLKYNKDFALVLQLNNGDNAINDEVLPYFKGQAGNPGLYFTEGQVNSIQPFKMDAVHYAFNEDGEDVHNYISGYLNWDNIINLWAGEFGIVANGLNFPSLADADLEVNRIYSYTQRKTLSSNVPGGYRTQTYVVPQDGQGQLSYARNKYLAVYDNSTGALPNPTAVENFGTIDGIQVSRSPMQSGFYNQVQQLAQLSNENSHPVGTYYLDGFGVGSAPTFNVFKQEMNQVAATFGRNGSDNIWVATSAELFEFLRVKELVEMQTQINGNIVEVTFSADQMPVDFREYCMTIIVEGESNIVEMVVEQPDNISTYQYNGSDALLNLKWRGSVVPDLETQATTAVEQTENQPTAATPSLAWICVDASDGDLKSTARRLCVLITITNQDLPRNEFLGGDTTVCLAQYSILKLLTPIPTYGALEKPPNKYL